MAKEFIAEPVSAVRDPVREPVVKLLFEILEVVGKVPLVTIVGVLLGELNESVKP
jgi:hypothetical protein